MQIGDLIFDENVRSQTNTLILGPPGYGKSRLMEKMIREDLHYKRFLMFVDRHGSSYQRMKRWCAYMRASNVSFIDPSEGQWVYPTNFFGSQPGVDTSTQTSSMVDAVMSLWGDSNANSYPVMFKLLKVAFTVVVEKEMPLSEVFHLLVNKQQMNRQVATLKDSYIKAVWQDLNNLSHSEWTRQVTPTINRLFRLVQSKAVQRFLCIPSPCFNLTFQDTIFWNLGTSGNLDNDAANMFLVLLVNALYQQSKRRRGSNGKDPTPYHVYIDEFVVPTFDYARILSECRKFGLLMTLATQDLSQIRQVFGGNFADTILTLCQCQICFGGINDADATRLAREWQIDPSVIRCLAPRQCVVKLPQEEVQLIEVSKLLDPGISDERILRYESFIAASRRAIPVEEVDNYLSRSQNEEEDFDPYE